MLMYLVGSGDSDSRAVYLGFWFNIRPLGTPVGHIRKYNIS